MVFWTKIGHGGKFMRVSYYHKSKSRTLITIFLYGNIIEVI